MDLVTSFRQALMHSAIGRIAAYLVQFISVAILARFFLPEAFGLLAAVQVFVLFFQMLSEVGLAPALVNQATISKSLRNAAYGFTVLVGISVAIALFFLSSSISQFLGRYEYVSITQVICIAVFFQSISTVPYVAQVRERRFFEIAKVEIIAEVASLALTLLSAQFIPGYLALTLRFAFTAIMKWALFMLLSSRTIVGRPALVFSLKEIRPLLGFSAYQFSFNFVNYFSRNFDNFLIAKYFGPNLLGVYERSYQLMRYPLMVLTSAITPAIQPVIAAFRNEPASIVSLHNGFIKRMSYLGVLAGGSIAVSANQCVRVLFGEQWQQVVPLIEILAIIIPVQVVMSTSGSFYQGLEKPKLMFYSGLISAIVNVCAIIIGWQLGSIERIAQGIVISFTFNFIQVYFVLYRFVFNCSFYLFLRAIAGPLLFSLVYGLLFIVNPFRTWSRDLDQVVISTASVLLLLLPVVLANLYLAFPDRAKKLIRV